MIGTLNSAQSYIELKKYLKAFNETKRRVDANPNDFKHYFGGNDFDPNSIMAINTIMANERGRKKPQAEYEKLSACVTFSNAITGNNSNDASKLATLNDVDCSYYCFSKELGEVMDKKSVSGGKKLKNPEEFSTNLIATAQKNLEDKEAELKSAKKETGKARRKLAGKRMLFLLSFLPSIAVLFATGFAAYAGISWLAVQTITFSPVVLGIAFLPAVGGLLLTNYLLRKVIERAAKNVGKAKGEVTACKENEKKAERERKKSFEEYAALYKHANKILKGYTYEPNFNAYLGEEALRARAEEAKNSKDAEANPEKPQAETAKQVEQKPVISAEQSNLPQTNLKASSEQAPAMEPNFVGTAVAEENLQNILNAVDPNREQNISAVQERQVEEKTEQAQAEEPKKNEDIADEMQNILGEEETEQNLEKAKDDIKKEDYVKSNEETVNAKNSMPFIFPDENFTFADWLEEQKNPQPELLADELNNIDNLFKQNKEQVRNSSESEEERQEKSNELKSYLNNSVQTNLTEHDIELADNMFKDINAKSANINHEIRQESSPEPKQTINAEPFNAVNNSVEQENEPSFDTFKRTQQVREPLRSERINNYATFKGNNYETDDNLDNNIDYVESYDNESVAVTPYNSTQSALEAQEKPRGKASKRKISIKDIINATAEQEIKVEQVSAVSRQSASRRQNESTAIVPTRKLLAERTMQNNNDADDLQTFEDYDNDFALDDLQEVAPRQTSLVNRPENSTALAKPMNNYRSKVVKNATKLKKQEEEQKRQEANERLELESQELSRKEMFDNMNYTLEDNYSGDFSEIVPADFMNLEQQVNVQFEQAKEIKRQGATSPQEKEFVARAEYEKAVCDYYGRFVPRTYTDGRIIKPVDHTLNYTPNENLGYDDLKKKKSILNYKQKAFKALVELGSVSLENQGADERVIETGMAVFNSQIEIAKQRSLEVENEIANRNRAIMANVASSISVAMGTKSKTVRFNTKERKIAEDTVQELLRDNLKEYGKKKYLAKSMSAKREALESEIEYLRDCDAKISAFSLFKQLNYKTSEELRYNLVLADANSRTLENLETLFKSRGVGNTPKSKVVHEQLEMTRNVEAFEEAKAEQNARDNELSSLGKLYDQSQNPDEKQAIKKRIDQTQLKNAQENADFESLKLSASEDALKQMQIIANFHAKKIKNERISVARDENVNNARLEKLDEAQQIYAEIDNSVNFTEQDYLSRGQDRLAVLENLKKKAESIDDLIKTANSKRFADKLERKDKTNEYKQMLLDRFKNMKRKQKANQNEVDALQTEQLESEEFEMER